MRFLAGAPLTALTKKQGGVRPIAVGDVIRRLVSKCVCNQMGEQFADYLMPDQVGVAVSGGMEALVHTFRRFLETNRDNADSLIFKADFQNAFNQVKRASFLRLVYHNAFLKYITGYRHAIVLQLA